MELTIKQAATQLGKSESTVRAWLRSGKLVGQKQGRTWAISPESLAALPKEPSRKASQSSKQAMRLCRQIVAQVVAELRPILQAAMQPQAQAIQAQAIQPTESQATESQTLRNENAQLASKVATLESQVQTLVKQLGELTQRPASQAPEPAKPQNQTAPASEAKPQGKAEARPAEPQAEAKRQPPDEAKAEKWAREHLAEWINERCQFQRAGGRTWRELGENKGEKIEVSGKLSQPRAYLHAIESWPNGQVWAKIKAKVALEICKNEKHLDALAG